MDNKQKNITKVACVLAISGVSFSLGHYSASSDSPNNIGLDKQQTTKLKENIQTPISKRIVIINQDQTQKSENETYNFGNMLSQELKKQGKYTIETSNEASANAGLESGYYTAKILIPSNFTSSVLSVNDMVPKTAQLEYGLSSKSSLSQQKNVEKDILNLGQELNTKISYLYINAIFEDFHRAQNQIDEVVENNDDTLSKIEKLANLDINNGKKVTLEASNEFFQDFNPDLLLNLKAEDFNLLATTVTSQANNMRAKVAQGQVNETQIENIKNTKEADKTLDNEFVNLSQISVDDKGQQLTNAAMEDEIGNILNDGKYNIEQQTKTNQAAVANSKDAINQQFVSYAQEQESLINAYGQENDNFINTLLATNQKINPIAKEINRLSSDLQTWVDQTSKAVNDFQTISFEPVYTSILDFMQQMEQISLEFTNFEENIKQLNLSEQSSQQFIDELLAKSQQIKQNLESNDEKYEHIIANLENSNFSQSSEYEETMNMIEQAKTNNQTGLLAITTINEQLESLSQNITNGHVNDVVEQLKENFSNLKQAFGVDASTEKIYQFVAKLKLNHQGILVYQHDDNELVVGNERGEIPIPYDELCQNDKKSKNKSEKLTCDALSLLKIINNLENEINKNNLTFKQQINSRITPKPQTQTLYREVPENINEITNGYMACKKEKTDEFECSQAQINKKLGLSEIKEHLYDISKEQQANSKLSPNIKDYQITYSIQEKINNIANQTTINKLNLTNEALNVEQIIDGYQSDSLHNVGTIINDAKQINYQNQDQAKTQFNQLNQAFAQNLEANVEYQNNLSLLIDKMKQSASDNEVVLGDFNANLDKSFQAKARTISEQEKIQTSELNKQVSAMQINIDKQEQAISEFVDSLNDNTAYQKRIQDLSAKENEKNSIDKITLNKFAKLLPNTKNGDVENRSVYKFISQPSQLVQESENNEKQDEENEGTLVPETKTSINWLPLIIVTVLSLALLITVKQLKMDVNDE